MIYTRLVKDILDHCVAKYGGKPEQIVLGFYIANQIARESDYNFYQRAPIESFCGIPIGTNHFKPTYVKMVYNFEFDLPYGADENTKLYFTED